MLQNLVLLLVLIGPLLFAEGQEFGGYVDVVYICGVCACPQRDKDLLQKLPTSCNSISSSDLENQLTCRGGGGGGGSNLAILCKFANLKFSTAVM